MTGGQLLAVMVLVGIVVPFIYGFIYPKGRPVDSYPPYQPYLPSAPRIEDPTAPPVTYEDRAKWLPVNIRRDIERELTRR